MNTIKPLLGRNALSALAAVAALGTLAAAPVHAAVIASGSLSSADGGIIVGGTLNGKQDQTWANDTVTLAWTVDQADSLYTYTYTFNGVGSPFKPGLSHLIVQTSATFTSENVFPGTSSGVVDPALYTPTSNGNSNPSLPGDIYGIKWNTQGNGSSWSFSIVSDRDPVWGNFYANGGRDGFAYNAGWLDLLDNEQQPQDGLHMMGIRMSSALSGGNWFIAVPDTTSNGGDDVPGQVPVPATGLLLGIGLLAVSVSRRKSIA